MTASRAMAKADPSRFWEALHESERLARHATIYTWAARQIPPGWVLDVGCECGFGSLLVAETNPSVRIAGVDVDLSALTYSQESLPDPRTLRVNGDGFRLPIASGSVSGMYLVNLLHLVAEPAGILSEVWRALAPDGVAILSVPREPRDGPRDGRPYSEGVIERLADEANVFFGDVTCPVEIRGQLPSFPPRSFRLEGMPAPWIALCRKKRVSPRMHAA